MSLRLSQNNQTEDNQATIANFEGRFISFHEMQNFLHTSHNYNINQTLARYKLLFFDYTFRNAPKIIGCFENLLCQISFMQFTCVLQFN